MSQKPITDRECRSRCPVATSFCSREAMPKATMRPNGARVRRQASKRLSAGHLEHGVDLLAVVGLEDRLAQVLGARVDRRVGAQPRGSSRLSSLEASAITLAPARLASWTASVPVPPAAAWTTTVSPGCEVRAAVDQRVRGQALEQQRRRPGRR